MQTAVHKTTQSFSGHGCLRLAHLVQLTLNSSFVMASALQWNTLSCGETHHLFHGGAHQLTETNM